MTTKIIPSSDPKIFAEQVRAEAHRRATELAGGAVPFISEIEKLIPVVRDELAGARGLSMMDRISAAISFRREASRNVILTAEQEVERLVELRGKYEVLSNDHERALENLTRADQIAENIRQDMAESAAMIPGFYTGHLGGGVNSAQHVITSYGRIAAAERALAEFSAVRAQFEAEVEKAKQKITSFEKANPDITPA